ncbi:AGD9, partial [Symbiodinium pilosum]
KGRNMQCFDCGVADVTWASPKLGTFLCVTCSDVHRAAGAHITCVKNFSTYLWSPDEVSMMRLVGNNRAQELYRPSSSLSWSPQDSKERKVQLCTQLYGSAKAQATSSEMIAAATSESVRAAGQDVKAQGAKTYANPDWFDDWSTPTPIREEPKKTSPPQSVDLLGDLLDLHVEPQKPRRAQQNGYVDLAVGPMVDTTPQKMQQELASVFDIAPLRPAELTTCAMQTVKKDDRDFWNTVNWDDLMK